MSMKGYVLPNGDVDHRALVADARAYAAESQSKPAQKYIFLLCKAVERMADKLGKSGQYSIERSPQGETMKKMTPEEISKATPATEQWVKDALKFLGQPALDSENNHYAYGLRLFELRFPLIAKLVIPLFSRAPTKPWWSYTVHVRGR